ncbi:MAG TPA: 2-dehydro-3-deoxygalactonokinase [Opitutaceae bacterium]|nr:2-dehydro-3-deoxygalactonokinase [Opitutaceae bacterium]
MRYFLSCDWGTTRFRLRLVEQKSRRIVSEITSPQGIQVLASQHPAITTRHQAMESELAQAIVTLGVAEQIEIPLVISGMVSSTLGWHSLPYACVPAKLDGRSFIFQDLLIAGRNVRLVSGLRTECDVMRGEETELVGIFSSPERQVLSEHCVVILPGTHSKHVYLRNGNIIDFTTFLTGELYQILRSNSTLGLPGESTFATEPFLVGVQTSRQLGLSAALFKTRSRNVLGHLPANHTTAFLSGALIGAELSTLKGIVTKTIVLAASEELSRPYALALSELLPEIEVVRIPAPEMNIATVPGHALLLTYP